MISTDQQFKDVCQKAIVKWGPRLQIFVMLEEMAELQKELCKYQRESQLTDERKAAIAEEIADVEIMLEQMKMTFGISRDVLLKRLEKIERLSHILKDPHKKGGSN